MEVVILILQFSYSFLRLFSQLFMNKKSLNDLAAIEGLLVNDIPFPQEHLNKPLIS